VHRERLLMAANQVGKTLAGACEAAFHLTGLYPAWWEGKRWERPVKGWAGSESTELTRDGVQRMLVGPPKIEAEWGTGLIPASELRDRKRRQGVADALDGVLVHHVSGGVSTLGFKSYDQGRTRWQAETLDFVWFDEEPAMDLYTETMRHLRKRMGHRFAFGTGVAFATAGFASATAGFLGFLHLIVIIRFLVEETNPPPSPPWPYMPFSPT
jgi:hypothetical protein